MKTLRPIGTEFTITSIDKSSTNYGLRRKTKYRVKAHSEVQEWGRFTIVEEVDAVEVVSEEWPIGYTLDDLSPIYASDEQVAKG